MSLWVYEFLLTSSLVEILFMNIYRTIQKCPHINAQHASKKEPSLVRLKMVAHAIEISVPYICILLKFAIKRI